jgi:hypothetical protein
MRTDYVASPASEMDDEEGHEDRHAVTFGARCGQTR